MSQQSQEKYPARNQRERYDGSRAPRSDDGRERDDEPNRGRNQGEVKNAESAKPEGEGALEPVPDITRAAFLETQFRFGICLAILKQRENIVGQGKLPTAFILLIGGFVLVGQIERAGILIDPLVVIVSHSNPRHRSLNASRGIDAKA